LRVAIDKGRDQSKALTVEVPRSGATADCAGEISGWLKVAYSLGLDSERRAPW